MARGMTPHIQRNILSEEAVDKLIAQKRKEINAQKAIEQKAKEDAARRKAGNEGLLDIDSDSDCPATAKQVNSSLPAFLRPSERVSTSKKPRTGALVTPRSKVKHESAVDERVPAPILKMQASDIIPKGKASTGRAPARRKAESQSKDHNDKATNQWLEESEKKLQARYLVGAPKLAIERAEKVFFNLGTVLMGKQTRPSSTRQMVSLEGSDKVEIPKLSMRWPTRCSGGEL